MTLNEHIQRYLRLVNTADALFDQVRQSHAKLMPCKVGCDDCCSVYFQLTLIEAFIINGYFRHELDSKTQQDVLARTKHIEPLFEQALGRLAPKNKWDEKGADTSMGQSLGAVRIPCVLHMHGSCLLYQSRPITCRLYGAPQRIGDQVIACPRTGFQVDHAYLAVDVTKINESLQRYSAEFLADLLGITSIAQLDLFFPLPTALRLSFDKTFFTSLREKLET